MEAISNRLVLQAALALSRSVATSAKSFPAIPATICLYCSILAISHSAFTKGECACSGNAPYCVIMHQYPDLSLGSTVTLVSKSNIRYTGTLYTVDPTEHTISLADVRALGTEGRGTKYRQVLPDCKVYEYIIFRRADVRDVKVVEKAEEDTRKGNRGWKRVARQKE